MATTLTLAQVEALSYEQLIELKTRIGDVLEMKTKQTNETPHTCCAKKSYRLKGLLIVSDKLTKPALGDVWSILKDVFYCRLVMETAKFEDTTSEDAIGGIAQYNTYKITFHPDQQEMAEHLWQAWCMRYDKNKDIILTRTDVVYSLCELEAE